MNYCMKFNATREKINVACIPVDNVSEKRESAYRVVLRSDGDETNKPVPYD